MKGSGVSSLEAVATSILRIFAGLIPILGAVLSTRNGKWDDLVFSLLLGVVLIYFGWFLRVNKRVGVVFVLASSWVMVVAAEFVMGSITKDSLVAAIAAAREAGTPFDQRTKIEVAEALSQSGIDVVASFTPSFLRQQTQNDPEVYDSVLRSHGEPILVLAGISRRRTVLCNESGQYAVFDSDEHGFNNPVGLWGRSVDVLAVGDSVVMGHCVAQDQNAIAYVRDDFPLTLNLGFSGHSPLMTLASLAEYGPATQAREVLFFYSENDLDWYEIGKDKRTPRLLRYLDSNYSQGLIDRQHEIDKILASFLLGMADRADNETVVQLAEKAEVSSWQILSDSLLLRGTRNALRSLLRRPSSDALADRRENEELFSAVLKRARSIVESWGGRLHIVYMPGVLEFELGRPSPDREVVINAAAANDLAFVDVYEQLAIEGDPRSLYSLRSRSSVLLPHLNPNGYKVVGEFLSNYLKELD